jgi:hypothetical protein
VLGACLEELFALFYHNTFTKPFDRENNVSNEDRIQEINSNYLQPLVTEKKVTIANLLPPVSRQSHLIINSNEYLNVSLIYVVLIEQVNISNLLVILGLNLRERAAGILSDYIHSIRYITAGLRSGDS